jgi:hypothetical protein
VFCDILLCYGGKIKVLDLISKLVQVVEPSHGFKVEMFHQNKFNGKYFTLRSLEI